MTSWRGANALYIARKLGLTSGLQVCLDAGDAGSYSSGQTWADLSGNGYDFWLGASVDATASDPTFNGTAGRLSSGEYFSCDGGDYFTLAQNNPTWVQDLHKDNAQFTFLAWVQFGAEASFNSLFGTRGSAAGTGIAIWLNASERLALAVQNAGSSVLLVESVSPVVAMGSWVLCSVSVDEAVGTGGGFHGVNGSFGTFTSTYSSPSAGTASHRAQILSRGNGDNPISANSRLGMAWIWGGRTVTQGEVRAVFNASRGRYGV